MKNNNLKAAVIGCGNIGGLYDTPTSKSITTHAHAYINHKNTKLRSCCDINIKNLQSFKNIWGRDINTYTSLEEMLKRESLDIVSIATDSSSHFEILKRLLSTDIKYIICEKPFVSTLDELSQIQKLLKYSDKKLIINFIRCFDPTMKKVKKLIKSNKLGKVLSFNAFCNKGIYHNGSHLLSLIEYLMQDIKSIEVKNKFIKEDDIYGNFLLKTKNITGTVTNFDKTDFSIFTMNIVLEKGYIEINNSGFEVNVYKSKKSNRFKGFNHLRPYKKYKNTLKNYAMNSLKFLLTQKSNKQLKKHLSISRKLLVLRESFLKKKTRKVKL
ncbi:MAG: Gfo/Idh/MocA family oxidoreductase [Campylobacterota bacterium]|nr:Gfo/Idh/MocA family oxidoreductase [Campylobacterota bacterium]